MATTGSPVRRSLVWSHNTTYTGAAGVHSEVSRKAHALHVTSERELSSNLSTIHSLHRKELQNLRHSRKSLETSMLAYTEKMRRISTDRLQLTDGPSAQNSATLERLLDLSKPSTNAASQARISVDSGINEDESSRVNDAVSAMSATRTSSTMKRSTSHPLLHQRPGSLNSLPTLESFSGSTDKTEGRRRKHNSSEKSGSGSRQRRSGTTDKPDAFALKLSMGNANNKQSARSDQEEDGDRSLSAVPSDVSVAITPFPEFQLDISEQGEGLSTSSVVDEDEERLQGTTSRTSQSSRKKSRKTKDNYWSYRKSPRRHSITPRSGTTGKPQEKTIREVSPLTVVAPKTVRGLIRGPRPEPQPKPKPFNHTFRYSEAVEGVIKSLDASKDVDEKAFRRASEILPTLDLHNLREERRMKEKAKKALLAAQYEELVSPSNEESSISSTSEEEPVVAVARERSISAPNILEHDPDSGCGSDGGSEEREGELELKPVLRKSDSAHFFQNVPPRKTVHFDLPDLTREAQIVF